MLLCKGASVSATDEDGQTLLHYLVGGKCYDEDKVEQTARLLIVAGADVWPPARTGGRRYTRR